MSRLIGEKRKVVCGVKGGGVEKFLRGGEMRQGGMKIDNKETIQIET